jgi:hypothetical protein
MDRGGGRARPGASAGRGRGLARGPAGRGLATEEERRYRYGPPSDAVERTIDELAESYAKYRVTVIGLIFSKPSERITVFSDAFRIRRKR